MKSIKITLVLCLMLLILPLPLKAGEKIVLTTDELNEHSLISDPFPGGPLVFFKRKGEKIAYDGGKKR